MSMPRTSNVIIQNGSANNKAKALANSRFIDFDRWSDDSHLNQVVEFLIDEIEQLRKEVVGDKLRIHRRKLRPVIKVVIMDLYAAYKTDHTMYLRIPRDKAFYSKYSHTRYLRSEIKHSEVVLMLDSLKDERLCYLEHYIGGYDNDLGAGYQTRIRAAEKLIKLMNESCIPSEVFRQRREDEELIIVKVKKTVKDPRTGKKKEKTEWVDYKDTPKTKRMRENLRKINDMIKNTYIDLHLTDDVLSDLTAIMRKDPERSPLDFTKITVKRIFNDKGFTKGGRFYGGWWQQIPSMARQYIQIHELLTVEQDYSTMHILFLYAQAGHEPPDSDDLYTLKGVSLDERGSVKIALNTLINAETEEKAIQALQDKRKVYSYMERLKKFKDNVFFKKKRFYECPKVFKSHQDFINALKEKHKPISQYFGSGEGITLQCRDAMIAEKVILQMYKKYKSIVLPVHDSFVVRSSLGGTLREMMESAFEEEVGRQAKIKKVAQDWALEPEYPPDKDNPNQPKGSLSMNQIIEGMHADEHRYVQYEKRRRAWYRSHPGYDPDNYR